MNANFNALRSHIASDFNRLVFDIKEISENISEADQYQLLEALNELRNNIWGLMCLYTDEKDKDFWKSVRLEHFERESEE